MAKLQLAPSRRNRSAKTRTLIKNSATHVVLVALSLIFIFPIAWLLLTAVKPMTEVLHDPPIWVPTHFEWNNFGDAMKYQSDTLGYIPFLVYARNTIVLCILVVTGTVVSNAIVAYSFARLRWPGRDLMFAFTLATMMIPFPVLMVPTFTLFHNLNWLGSFRPLWIPSWFGAAFNIFLLRQFFKTIPFELSEAARLDGASEWKIFAGVIVPLCKPALGVVALFSFLYTWNDFIGPLIYLLDQKQFTLALGLQSFQNQHGGTPFNQQMAASALVILPVMILFFFTQRLFVQGISITGLK